MNPKASIVIPAYNEEKYIAQTLKAALIQDYGDFEVIVVDNGSTDRTESIVKKFPSVKVVYESRKGTQSAREAGRKAAVGRYIAFIDADCIPSPDWLSSCVKALESGYVGVSGPYYYYDTSKLFNWAALLMQSTFYWSFSYMFQFLKIGGVMIAGNAAMTKEALEKINGFDTSIKFYGDDTDTVKKLTKIGTVYFDLRLMMKTSGRRFHKMGVLKTFSLYLINFFWISFFKKPFINE